MRLRWTDLKPSKREIIIAGVKSGLPLSEVRAACFLLLRAFYVVVSCLGWASCSRDAYLVLRLQGTRADVESLLASIEITALKEPYQSTHPVSYQAFVSVQGATKEPSFFLPEFAEDGSVSVSVRAFQGRCTIQRGEASQEISRSVGQEMTISLQDLAVPICW